MMVNTKAIVSITESWGNAVRDRHTKARCTMPTPILYTKSQERSILLAGIMILSLLHLG